jgi:serine O-acetyltransferase
MSDEQGLFFRIREDLQTVFAKDPAARTLWEVLLLYPGLHAIWLHRLAHALWHRRLYFVARLLAHVNRWLTGVEIHPAATIGRRLFIDHGMGIVIGETTEIGDDVLMYQGAVLGGTRLVKTKRHPTIGNHVVVGAGATILGPIAVGDHARIGAGSVVIKDVPAGAMIVGVPGHIAGPERFEAGTELEHGRLPDPVLRGLSEMLDRQSRTEERLQKLERLVSSTASPAPPEPNSTGKSVAEPEIREALRQVIDPEVGINVVDLGLIRDIAVNGKGIEVRMVLTSPTCPVAGYLVEQVRRRVKSLSNGDSVEVVLLDEAWSWEDTAPHLEWGDGI